MICDDEVMGSIRLPCSSTEPQRRLTLRQRLSRRSGYYRSFQAGYGFEAIETNEIKKLRRQSTDTLGDRALKLLIECLGRPLRSIHARLLNSFQVGRLGEERISKLLVIVNLLVINPAGLNAGAEVIDDKRRHDAVDRNRF